ncbi:MAG: carboxylating nicotinate-nucleotide diphosphorylase, partial [Pirellulaceae bacterium]|nr:carboxylating nicotinate-nucleotide diphosphorylase [Pirellulaceae bacterium]
MEKLLSTDDLAELVRAARLEDLGPNAMDITSSALVRVQTPARATLRARQPGTLAGAALLPTILEVYDQSLRSEPQMKDGSTLRSGDIVAQIAGPMGSILAVERVALNFLTHTSGIATLAARYVEAVRGTRASIFDTRKTHPGLRAIEKYAAVCGGASSHRMGLHDAVLIKDNHLAALSAGQLSGAITNAVSQLRSHEPAPSFIAVEVDSIEQLRLVLRSQVDIVLLDNMDVAHLQQAVAIRDATAAAVLLEASGGITLENV